MSPPKPLLVHPCVYWAIVFVWGTLDGLAAPASRPVLPTSRPVLPASRPVGHKSQVQSKQVQVGQKLFHKHGCAVCHSTDGKACFGGTLKGLFGTIAALEGGRKMRRDEGYFLQKISFSAKLPLADGMNVMPIYQKTFTPRQLHQLVAYIKALTVHKKARKVPRPKVPTR